MGTLVEVALHGLVVQWDGSGVVVQVAAPSGAAVLAPDEAIEMARLLLQAAKQAQEAAA